MKNFDIEVPKLLYHQTTNLVVNGVYSADFVVRFVY